MDHIVFAVKPAHVWRYYIVSADNGRSYTVLLATSVSLVSRTYSDLLIGLLSDNGTCHSPESCYLHPRMMASLFIFIVNYYPS